ncbi:hypothetical protein [Halovenus salina]|uniref:HTH domain protein n=1 Tax=Halovenus salina TaxID=1510225 RepID=A0ABD5W3X9_9EURY
MSERERTDAGTYAETLPLDAVRDVFDAVRGPVITSSDVGDALDCTTEAARQKLTRLYDRGEVDKRKTGRTVVYWRTGGDRITPDERAGEEHAERARERDDARADRPDDQRDAKPTPTASTPHHTDEDGDIVDDVAEGWDDTGDRLDARKEAARAVLAYAREHGTVSKQEAKEEVRPEHPVEGQNARTWYRKNVRPVLNEAAEYDQSERAYRVVSEK